MRKRTPTILSLATVAVFGGASFWLAASTAAQTVHLPADAGDLSNTAAIEVKDGSGAVVLRGQFVEQPEDDDDVERKAQLIGSGPSAQAAGEAEIEVSKSNDGVDQELEVSVSNLTPGATYSVVLDSRPIGTFQTNEDGKGEVEFTSPPAAKP